MSRISNAIKNAPRHTPTRSSIELLQQERSRLKLREYRLAWSGADQWRILSTRDQIRGLELRIHEDEETLHASREARTSSAAKPETRGAA